MEIDNKKAYETILLANVAMRVAIAAAAESPLPIEIWNDYGRAMQLHERIRIALKPKGI